PPQIAYHAGSPQLDWLINDLQSHNNKCTLGVWYESMWFSSTHISNPNDPLHKNDYRVQDVRGVWTALYENNADLVVNGWPRIYERFAPIRFAAFGRLPAGSAVMDRSTAIRPSFVSRRVSIGAVAMACCKWYWATGCTRGNS